MMILAGETIDGQDGAVRGIDPRTGTPLEPAYGGATEADVDRAARAAAEAARPYRETTPEARATFLEAIAAEIEAIGDPLIDRAMAETGLPQMRLTGERGRTCGQLRLFAKVVRDGGWMDVRIDPALPDRQPAPRPDLRLRKIAVGPVAVFGASNFPLAFSVAGGDTASALAAGCPVVAKAHSAHPGTSALMGAAIARAAARTGMPAGTFSMVYGVDNRVGGWLVAHPAIKAVGFTGSRGGGLALMQIAAARAEPIPVYAEMSSINPVLLFPAAVAARGPAIAAAYAQALTMGVGQFCTNPGLLLLIEGPGDGAFRTAVTEAIAAAPAAPMLTPGIHAAYEDGVRALAAPGVAVAAAGRPGPGPHDAAAAVYETDAETLLADPDLQDEIFGPAGLIVRCADPAGAARVIEGLEGQLTIALHMDEGDHPLAAPILPLIEEKAGRILVNGFGTGVEVSHAMVHGGPFPATSDGRTTSVGSLAIDRFVRPVCYQDLPPALLPVAVRDDNPWGLARRLDGVLTLRA